MARRRRGAKTSEETTSDTETPEGEASAKKTTTRRGGAGKTSAAKASEPEPKVKNPEAEVASGAETGEADRAELRSRFHQTLGEAMWLLFQAPDYRSVQIGAIERLFLPAMQHQQFTLFRDQDRAVGLASWALLNTEAERAYLETGHLSPNDWKSGDRLWVIHFVAPFGGQAALAAALKERVIGGQEAWIASASPGGRRKAAFAEVAKAWTEAAAKAAAQKGAGDGEPGQG